MTTSRDERHSMSNGSFAFPVVAFEDQHAADVSQHTTRVIPSYAAVGSPDYAYFEWNASQSIPSPTISASPPFFVISAIPPSSVPSSTIPRSTLRPAKRARLDDDVLQGLPKVPRLDKEAGPSSPDATASEVQSKRKRVRKINKGPDHIPRPSNCFISFKNDYMRRLRESGHEVMSKGIAKEIGAIWRALPPYESQYWKDQAEGVKGQHKNVYPGYTYKPIHKKKTERPQKGGPLIQNGATELKGQEGKQNDPRPEEDKVAKRTDTLTESEDSRTVGNMRAVADHQHDSSPALQAQSHPPLHALPLPQGAVTAQYAETSSRWSHATQAVLQSLPQVASVVPSLQQARPSRLATPHSWQLARPNPMYP